MDQRQLQAENHWNEAHPRDVWLTVRSVRMSSCAFLERLEHRAKGWSLAFVTRGTGTVQFDADPIPLTAETALLLPPVSASCFEAGDEGLDTLAIGLDGVSLERRPAGLPMVVTDACELLPAIDLFLKVAGRIDAPVGPELDALACMMLATFTRLAGTDASPTWLCQVRQYVVNHLADPIQVDDVANVVKLSASRFSHRFKEETGTTFKHFLTSLRVSAAVTHLLQTDLPTSEVAKLTGFHDADYMARVIRQGTGHTPRTIRMARP